MPGAAAAPFPPGGGVFVDPVLYGILSEVGAVNMVGGNIEGETRVLTTAIVLETRKGNFEVALGAALRTRGSSAHSSRV